MSKPMMWICMLMVCATTTLLTFPTQKEGSHSTVTLSPAAMMPIALTCPNSDTVYLDAAASATYDWVSNISVMLDGSCANVDTTVSSVSFSCNNTVGTNTVTVDVSGTCSGAPESAQCNIAIVVLDTIKPDITCPIDSMVLLMANTCTANFVSGNATATDACASNGLTFMGNNITSPFTLHVGIHFFGYTVVDRSNNKDSCTTRVTVMDLNDPVLTCPATTMVNCGMLPAAFANGKNGITSLVSAGGSLMDACNLDSTSFKLDSIKYDSTSCPITIDRYYSVKDVNNNIDSCRHRIVSRDNRVLDISTITNKTLDIRSNRCDTTFILPQPIVSKKCAVLTTSLPGASTLLSPGVTSISWYAVDSCGNRDTMTYTVTVRDRRNPSLTCRGARNYGLTNPVPLAYPVDSFIVMTSDNCSGTVTRGVHRMDGGCVAGDELSDGAVNFCCSDVGNTVSVVVTVTDVAGNANTCMAMVTVSDKLGPVLANPLPAITVTCDYFIDLQDLSEFGKIAKNTGERDSIFIENINYDATNDFAGLDGLITDNCSTANVTITETASDNRVRGQGTIVRTFVISDGTNPSITTTQTITVYDDDLLSELDITWPRDTTFVIGAFNNCATNADSSITGFPIINDDDICTLPGVSKIDAPFIGPGGGCRWIKRTWRVVDFGQGPPYPKFEKVQYIKFVNSTPPTLDSALCKDRVVVLPNNACDQGTIQLTMRAKDDCTAAVDLYYRYIVDINNDGTDNFDNTNDTLAVTMPRGVHKITWKAEDRCGNLSKCDFLLTVQEGKAPTPVCLSGLSINLSGGNQDTVWAKDFNNHSSDNCTPASQLQYSFERDNIVMSRVLKCEDRGVKTVKMYVKDLEGNTSFCEASLTVTDLLHLCPTLQVPYYKIEGTVATDLDIDISNASITIDQNGNKNTYMTDEDGQFVFENLEAYRNYMISIDKKDDCMAGISTLDLVLIQRHILSIQKLVGPHQILAADVNQSATITASDLIELRRVILGLAGTFANDKCWLFVNSDHIFDDPQNPFQYQKVQMVENLSEDKDNANFTAVKLGDVNESFVNVNSGSIQNRGVQSVSIKTNDRVFESGQNLKIDMVITEDKDAVAFQSNFTFDNRVLEWIGISGGMLPIQDEMINIRKDGDLTHVTIAYADANAVQLSHGLSLFALNMKAKSQGKLSTVLTDNGAIIEGVLYDASLNTNYVQFDFDVEHLSPVIVGVASPNPFVDQTTVPVELGYDGPVEILIYDNGGRLIYKDFKQYTAGVHRLTVSEQMLNNEKGVFFLHISSGESNQIRKLIKIQ